MAGSQAADGRLQEQFESTLAQRPKKKTNKVNYKRRPLNVLKTGNRFY